jgi:hypothetical protein
MTLPPKLQEKVNQAQVEIGTDAADDGIWAAIDRACESEKKARTAAKWAATRHDNGRSDLTVRGILDLAVTWDRDADGGTTVRTNFVSGLTTQARFMLIPIGSKRLTGLSRIVTFGEALKIELGQST